MTTSTTPDEDRVRELIEENKRLSDRNVEVSMLAHGWMVAHDNRAAGLPVTYPSPADVPASLFLLALMAAAAEQSAANAAEWFDEWVATSRLRIRDAEVLRQAKAAVAQGREYGSEGDEGFLPSRGEDQGLSQSQPCTNGTLPVLKEPPCDLDGWQPIETAPLDGSYVDLWAFWPESEVWRRSPDARWGGDDWFMDRQYQRRQFVCPPVITHWMRHRDGPVPALPHSSTGEG